MKSEKRSAWQGLGRASRRLAVLMLLDVLGTGMVWAQSPGTFTAVTSNMMDGGASWTDSGLAVSGPGWWFGA